MNVEDLGPNELIQNIALLTESGHYDHEKFPWHTKMADMQCGKLEEMIDEMGTEERIHLIIALARIPIEPATRLTNICFNSVSTEQFEFRVFQMCLDENYCNDMAKKGPTFLNEDDPMSQFLCHYLYASNITISGENIRKELEEISRTVLADAKLSQHVPLLPVQMIGQMEVSVGCLKITKVLKLPTESNVILLLNTLLVFE